MNETETKNLTEEDIITIVTRELPRLIAEHPDVYDKFVDLMSDAFAKKSDHAVLLSELRMQHRNFTAEMQALREDFQASREESDRRFEQHYREIKALREDFQASREESDRRFEQHSREIKALREGFQASHIKLEAKIEALREDMQSGLRALDNKIVGLGARWGIMSEEAFREGLKGILTDEIGLKVERYEGYDEEGYVFGRPDQIELDVVVKDGILIIMEIRSSMSKSDVYTFQRKIEFYEKFHNVEVNRKIILSPFIDHRAIPAANGLRMETYYSASSIRT